MSETLNDLDPKLPAARMHLAMPNQPVSGRVTTSESCLNGKSASFVRHVCIDVSGTALEGNFLPGQSFGVIPPGLDARGRPHKLRLYSIACPSWGEDGAGRIVSTTPKRLLAEHHPQTATDDPSDHSLFKGVCSNYLCDLRPGDEVLLTGPAGKRFLLPEDPNAHDYLFLATGTGIAPFRGMLLELLEGPPPGPRRAAWPGPCRSRIHLMMGTAYGTDLLYHGLLKQLAATNQNFTYHPVLSREPLPQPGYGPHVHHYLATRIGEFSSFLSSNRTLVYICGLAGMQLGLFRALGVHGLASGYLRVDERIRDRAPIDWTDDDLRRYIRPTHRCMQEVY